MEREEEEKIYIKNECKSEIRFELFELQSKMAWK